MFNATQICKKISRGKICVVNFIPLSNGAIKILTYLLHVAY